MKEKDMTALVSAFSRAYHSEVNEAEVKVFDDSLAKALLGDDYDAIAENMKKGIGFFLPGFHGTEEEGLRNIVDNQLSPSPLARSAFAEKALENAGRIGATQYILLAAGYDSFAYRQPDWAQKLQIFEVDLPDTSRDKARRVEGCGWEKPKNLNNVEGDLLQSDWVNVLQSLPTFSSQRISFCSMLGFSYYVDKEAFASLLHILHGLLPKGSSLAFDYPAAPEKGGQLDERNARQAQLAREANAEIHAEYSFMEMEKTLEESGFLAYEHLRPQEINSAFFDAYNAANPMHPIRALGNTNFCLAVRA